jgi:hypothetical protein
MHEIFPDCSLCCFWQTLVKDLPFRLHILLKIIILYGHEYILVFKIVYLKYVIKNKLIYEKIYDNVYSW